MRRIHCCFFALVACGLLSFGPRPTIAATVLGSDRPVPTDVSTVGTMRVEHYAGPKPAIVFVPGLACGSWVWDGEVRHFNASHELYVVTLAGFDGLAAPTDTSDVLGAAEDSLVALISSKKLDRPVLVGHSLGGHLAIRFGIDHSALVRGIVAVDGTPVFPALAQAPADQRAAAAASVATQLRTATPAQFAAFEGQLAPTMIGDPAQAAQAATLFAKSDPAATATYLSALMSADLRPKLVSLTAPTLEIVPVPTQPQPFEGPAAANATLDQRAKNYTGFYTTLFTGASNVTFTTITNSKHFAMLDQPTALDDALATFIAARH